MAFKLGKESRGFKYSGNVNIVRTPMLDGSLAEARNNGTIAIDTSVEPRSSLDKRIIKPESKHMQDMEEGRANYGENWIMWEGKIYIRKNGMIDGPAGRLPEGHPDHPWEAEAIAAENEN